MGETKIVSLVLLRFSDSKRVSWSSGEVFPTECVESYPKVGMSPSFCPETRKSIFFVIVGDILSSLVVFCVLGRLQAIPGVFELRPRTCLEVR